MRWRPTKKKNNFLPILIFVLIIGVFLSYMSVRGIWDTPVKAGKYTISKWVTLSEMPKILNLDIADWRYKFWLKYISTTTPKIQAGTYDVDKTTTLSEVFTSVLTKPVITDLTITVLPGWNIYDIDDALANKKIIEPGALLLAARDHFGTLQDKYSFLKWRLTLEGFLYPDTYRVLPTADAYMILDRLLGEFDKKIGESYKSLGDTAYESLILASIVEREERNSSEKPIVADILAKRVKEWIPMWADATVCYGYAKTQKQCTPAFIGEVIYKKDPYNTRNKQGYPPTPISSISQDTWEAVMNKKSSPYYYYLHDNDGTIHYGKTLAEHNANKAQYLK
jgi:UPF0755 protein